MVCTLCQDPFGRDENIINSGGQVWHEGCFVCVQCFQPFKDEEFYEHEGRKYCAHDFHALFAPCCSGCGEFVVGRVIRAMSQCWHPNCFKCVSCHRELADIGFVKSQGRSVRASFLFVYCSVYVCRHVVWVSVYVCMCCASLPSTTLALCPHLDICYNIAVAHNCLV
jgi:hypothetical protein